MCDHLAAVEHARRRGAPLRRTPARGDGVYTCGSLAGSLEAVRRQEPCGLEEEIDLLRAYIRRLVEQGEETPSSTGTEGTDSLSPLCLALATLSHLVWVEQTLEALRDGAGWNR